MAQLCHDMTGLNLSNVTSSTTSRPSQLSFEESLDSLLISDTLVSAESMQKVKQENVHLRNQVEYLTRFYNEYTITLHKMVALLKKQNAALTKSLGSQSQSMLHGVESLSLLDNEKCHDPADNNNSTLDQNQVHLNAAIETSLQEGREKLIHLSGQLEKFKQHVDNLSKENSSLSDSNQQLSALVKIKDDDIQVMNNKVNMCTNMLEEHNRSSEFLADRASQPWVVEPSEISVSNQLLGTGAWGTVSLGTFRGMTVAVKQLHRLILSPHNQEKFLREMEISSRIRHPHILQFICCSQLNQTLFVVTEVMEVSAREAYLSNAISKPQSLRALLQCALALQYLHCFKPDPIIHRDISSCNVLLSARSSNGWVAKLSDFGAANFLRDNLSTSPGAAIYAAPEAYSSVQNTKLDVFSFGVLMIEMLIHRLPDPASRDSHFQLVQSAELKDIIGTALARNPAQRPEISSIVGAIRVVLNLPPGVPSDCI